MNFIRIDKLFINLATVESIEVSEDGCGVRLVVMYKTGRTETQWTEIPHDVIVDVSEVVDNLASAIKEAILSCSDADCEDVYDYFDDFE